MKQFSLPLIAMTCALAFCAPISAIAASTTADVSVGNPPAPQAVPAATIVVLTESNYHEEVDGSKVPVLLLYIGDNCASCADIEAKVRALAVKYPTFKIAIANISLFTGTPVPPQAAKILPSLITFVPGHPFLYRHDNIDKIAGGIEALVDTRAAAMTKLWLLYNKGQEVESLIQTNRQAFNRLDALRKPSGRAEREHLDQALAELYERKAAIIRQISPIVEDENDAGPAIH